VTIGRGTLLVLKTVRFEAAFVVLASAGLAMACLVCAVALDEYGLAGGCIGAWLAGTPSATCTSTVEAWASLSSDAGGRLLLASGLVPVFVGLTAGVVLIGRELESGTAELSWSLSKSRVRWLRGRLAVLGSLVIACCALVAVASARLETAHTADGLWISPYADAELYGLPVVARGVLSFGIGALAGAAIGRTLPAFLVGMATVAVILSVTSAAQPAFARMPVADVGGAGYVAAYLADPDVEFRFLTRDGEMLTEGQALALAPSGADPASWLQSNLQLLPLGVSASKTFSWQLLVSSFYASVGFVVLATGSFIGLRRRPLAE
jgi:hypothetical protein